MFVEIHSEFARARGNVVAVHGAGECLVLHLFSDARNVHFVNAPSGFHIRDSREKPGEFVAGKERFLEQRDPRHAGEIGVREDGAANLFRHSARGQNGLSFRGVVRELRVDLPVEVVQQSGDAPLFGVGAVLARVSREAGFHGQRVAAQSVGPHEFTEKLPGLLTIHTQTLQLTSLFHLHCSCAAVCSNGVRMPRNIQQTVSPVDGSVYAERALASSGEIDAALARAVEAQREWRHTPLSARADICRAMTAYMIERSEEIGEELTWQMGRPIIYSPMEIRRGFAERAAYMTEAAAAALADIKVEPKENFRRFIRREPLGVVLVLSPWNYPYLTSVNAIVPALLAGNSVILKMAPQTALAAERWARAFAAAGLPGGVFQFLHIDHAQVADVIGDPRIAFVAFTGSVAGGHAVQQAASGRFLATGLELGGKDPAYVRADAALEAAIDNLVDGACFNSGQSCCAVERIYVHEAVYEPFVEGFVELTRKYRLGNPLDRETTLGPMVSTQAADKVRLHIGEAVSRGARALIGAREFEADRPGTPYVAPQVLVNVDHSMLVMREETFGPVAGVMKVKDDAEAVRLMNDSAYGLTASIWTQDVDAALAIGEEVETGTCFLNRCDYLDPALAWTGVKDSGRGCTLSRLGFDAFVRPKSFHFREWPG